MAPIFRTTLYSCHLQCDFLAALVEKLGMSLFQYLLNLGWPCDSLEQTEYSGSDSVPVLNPIVLKDMKSFRSPST